MRNPVQASPRFGEFKSYDKVASRLLASHPDVFYKPGKSKEVLVRSLGAKIGELDRGKTAWWLKREREMQCLIDLLEIERDDLGLYQKSGKHIVALPVFPDFPPLDLQRENYWSIAAPQLLSKEQYDDSRYAVRSIPKLDAWFSARGHISSDKTMEWLHVPDKTEYQLLTEKLDATGRHQFIGHPSVREALVNDIEHVHSQQPLVLAIHENPEADHVNVLLGYRQGAPLLVISPFPMPNLWTKDAEEDEKDGKSTEPASPEKDIPAGPDDVRNWIWTMLPDWRMRLLDWLEKRMTKLEVDSFFTSGAADGVLQQFDPSGKWFASVEDVLVLCQAVSEKREKKLQASAGSSADVNELLALLFNDDTSGVHLIRPLVERRWKRWDLAWEGELDQQTWNRLVDNLSSFESLLKQKVIVQGMKGFDFRRPILTRLLLRSHLMAAMKEGDLTSWAPACFDNQRRPMVDAALDVLDINELELISSQLREAPALADTIGASEAVFAAIGRRIIREEDIGSELPLLADQVLAHLTLEKDLLFPCSRPLNDMAQQLEWIGACWAWSLTPAPDSEHRHNWIFPGWNTAPSETLPKLIDFYASSTSTHHWSQMAVPVRDFLSVVTRWLARHDSPPMYKHMPLLFNAGLLACAAANQWEARDYWWHGLLGSPVPEQTLLRQVESADPAVNRRTALAWWPSLVKHRREEFNRKLAQSQFVGSGLFTRNPREPGYSALLGWVMEQMDKHGEQALRGLDDEDRQFLIRHPAALSTPVKRQLLKSLAKDFPKDWHPIQFINLLLHYGPETAAEMEAFLDRNELGDQAAGYLWEWAPRRAEELLRKSQVSHDALRRLVLASPDFAIGNAVALLKQEPALLEPHRLQQWARARLPNARLHAQDLMYFLTSTREK